MSFVKVGPIDQLVEGDVKAIRIGEQNIVLSRYGDEVFALDNVCSHDESPFDEATTEEYELICPRHEGRFDVRTGKATCFPAVWPIARYPVRVIDGIIEVSPQPGGGD